jgi:GNAT superfamily N-acetyltransferase
MSDSPVLRDACPEDRVADHIRSIYEEFGLGFDLDFEDDLIDVCTSYRGGAFWVVEDEQGLVATGGVLPAAGAAVVKRIYVAPRGRRVGLAQALLRRCMGWGGYGRTELWSDVRFRGAHRLYLREGFVAGHTRVLDDPDRSVERYFSWTAGRG